MVTVMYRPEWAVVDAPAVQRKTVNCTVQLIDCVKAKGTTLETVNLKHAGGAVVDGVGT